MGTSTLERYRNSVFGGGSNDDNNDKETGIDMNTTYETNNNSRRKKDRPSQLQDYLRSQRLTRATFSRNELQEHTDVKLFISSHFANLISYVSVVVVFFCVGWMGWGRDLKGSYVDINSKYQVSLFYIYLFNSFIRFFLSFLL